MGACKTAFKAACKFARKHCHLSNQAPACKASFKEGPAASDASSMVEVERRAEDDVAEPRLILDHEMTAIIKHNLSQNREMEVEQAQKSGSITAIKKNMTRLRHHMDQLQDKITVASSFDEPGSDADSSERELDKVRDQLIELEKEKESLKQYLDEVKECQLEVLRSVFAEMDKCYVEEGLMGEVDPCPMGVYLRLANEGDDSDTATPAHTSAITTPKAPYKPDQGSSDTASSCSLPASSLLKEPPASPYIIPVVDQKDSLRSDYESARACLHGVEEDFEQREYRFDQARAEYAAEAGNDDSSTARLQLDLDELLETRRLAKELAKAEDWVVEAKEACLAAGVDVAASDLSSGFLDDVNDGYRISQEKELIDTVNSAVVVSWLKGIPDNIKAHVEPRDPEGLEIDHWDAQSVEIEDSASMVAEGASRRRIDKWRMMCQEATASDEGIGLFALDI